MRIRGSGAARICDAAGGVPASLRELRPRRSADRRPQVTRQSWLLAYPPFGAILRSVTQEVGSLRERMFWGMDTIAARVGRSAFPWCLPEQDCVNVSYFSPGYSPSLPARGGPLVVGEDGLMHALIVELAPVRST